MTATCEDNYKKGLICCMIVFCLLIVAAGLWHTSKPLPPGISYAGTIHTVDQGDIQFLKDVTYMNGTIHSQQEIFDQITGLITDARTTIIMDMFLFNEYQGSARTELQAYRNLSTDITDALLKKAQSTSITIITDSINTAYGASPNKNFREMTANNITIIYTNRTALRDSNIFYSPLYRIFFSQITATQRILPHPFAADVYVPLTTWLDLLNTKANHRKIIVADTTLDGKADYHTIITSANPHDASSRHTNVAFKVRGPLATDVIISEQAVASLSQQHIPAPPLQIHAQQDTTNDRTQATVQLLTEGKIKENLLADIASLNATDSIDLGMFYLSDRDIVKALLAASKRNVTIRIVLDANKDAFGREKNGIPNRQVAYELQKKSDGKIDIRWFATNGEQFHAKFIILTTNNKKTIYLGSANFTKRNLDDRNLESNIKLTAPHDFPAATDTQQFFESIWNNDDGIIYTLDFDAYKESSVLKYWIYRIQEATGLSSF